MEYVLIVVGVMIIINLFVSALVSRRDDLEWSQKIAQIIIIWLIPFIGAIGLWVFHRSQDIDNNKKGSDPIGGGPQDSIGASSYYD